MKKTLLTLAVIGLLSTTTTQAGLLDHFGAGLKSVPYLKVPLLKLAVPVPSVTVGPRAGTEVDGKVSGSGASAALPWIRGGVRWPSLTLGGGDATVTIGPKASKGDAAKKKAIAARKKKAASKKK